MWTYTAEGDVATATHACGLIGEKNATESFRVRQLIDVVPHDRRRSLHAVAVELVLVGAEIAAEERFVGIERADAGATDADVSCMEFHECSARCGEVGHASDMRPLRFDQVGQRVQARNLE